MAGNCSQRDTDNLHLKGPLVVSYSTPINNLQFGPDVIYHLIEQTDTILQSVILPYDSSPTYFLWVTVGLEFKLPYILAYKPRNFGQN